MVTFEGQFMGPNSVKPTRASLKGLGFFPRTPTATVDTRGAVRLDVRGWGAIQPVGFAVGASSGFVQNVPANPDPGPNVGISVYPLFGSLVMPLYTTTLASDCMLELDVNSLQNSCQLDLTIFGNAEKTIFETGDILSLQLLTYYD
jgi:hypothetical protein